jgi:hypothetical protein
MERAARELERVKDAVAKGGTVADAAKAVAGPRGVAWFEGSTGLFLASSATFTQPLPVPEGATEEEKAATARRSFVRQNGYDVVTKTGSMQDTQASGVGAVGGRVLKDSPRSATEPGTGAAYLVQVKERRDPAPEEMNARRYAAWLKDTVYDNEPWHAQNARLNQRSGVLPQTLARWFDDWDAFKRTFSLVTNRPIEVER